MDLFLTASGSVLTSVLQYWVSLVFRHFAAASTRVSPDVALFRHKTSRFVPRIAVFLSCHEHLNSMLESSFIDNFLLTMNGPRGGITCSRSSPKKRNNLTHLKFENRSRTIRFPTCLIRCIQMINQFCLVSFLDNLFNNLNQKHR